MVNYQKDVEDEATDFMAEHEDELINALSNEKEAWDYLTEDGMDSAFHCSVGDRGYSLEDATFVVSECENEESDTGLWEGLQPEEAITRKAAYSYANDVKAKIEEIYDQLAEEAKYLFDDADSTWLDTKEAWEKSDKTGEEPKEPSLEAFVKAEVKEWVEKLKNDQPEPLEEGSQAELNRLRAWLDRSDKVGIRGSGPMGSSYIDARCGVGYGQPDQKDYIDFDHETAKMLPHISGKYRRDVEARVAELEAVLEPQTISDTTDTEWAIVDGIGIMETGPEEEVKAAWDQILAGDYEKSRKGDTLLVQIHGRHK